MRDKNGFRFQTQEKKNVYICLHSYKAEEIMTERASWLIEKRNHLRISL